MSDGILIHYKIQAARFNSYYTRKIFNVIDALAKLGGSFSALKGAGLAFTSFFSYQLMQSSLISKLFHFKPHFASELRKQKKKEPQKGSVVKKPKKKLKKTKTDKSDSDHPP